MTDLSRGLDAPRPVPFGLRCALLFGGHSNQLGWLCLAVGGVLAAIFLSRMDLGFFETYGASARGVIERVEATDMSENDVPILAVSYRFTAPDGQEVTGVSYSRGRDVSAGQTVRVELDPADPSTSRIQGMRGRPFSWMVILVALIPLAGLVFVVRGVRAGLRGISLVGHGRLATGTLVDAAVLRSDEDGARYRLTFEHEVDGARHRVSIESSRPELAESTPRAILHDPSAPARGVLVEELPGPARVGPDGALVAPSPPWAPALLLVPAAALATALVLALMFL